MHEKPASSATRPLHTTCKNIGSLYQEIANNALQVGGWELDCEIDDVAFRQTCRMVHGFPQITWIRHIAAARRGSRIMYLGRLNDRTVKGIGEG